MADEETNCAELEYFLNQMAENSTECHYYTQTLHLRAYCCDFSLLSTPQYDCEAEIYSQLMSPPTGKSYQASVPPTTTFGTPLRVDTHFTFYGVTDINMAAGLAEIFVWLELSWVDPRLAWNITAETCVPSAISVRASHDREITDIWVPDLDLFNKHAGVNGMDGAMAVVLPSGRVYWHREGPLKALCNFVGLRKFPFDTLGCQFMFGGRFPFGIEYALRMNRTNEDGTISEGEGMFFPLYNDRATYTEYRVVKEKTKTIVRNANEFNFRLFFKRAHQSYVLLVIIPVTVITYLSFGQLLMGDSIERISFGVSLMLILVTQSIVTSSFLPTCQENLWMNMFNTVSMFVTLGTMFISLLVCFGYKKEKLDMSKRAPIAPSTSYEGMNQNKSSFNGEPMETDKDEGIASLPEIDTEEPGALSWWNKCNNRQPSRCSLMCVIGRLDKIAAITLPIAYSIFLIAMFATLNLWDDDNEAIWSDYD